MFKKKIKKKQQQQKTTQDDQLCPQLWEKANVINHNVQLAPENKCKAWSNMCSDLIYSHWVKCVSAHF